MAIKEFEVRLTVSGIVFIVASHSTRRLDSFLSKQAIEMQGGQPNAGTMSFSDGVSVEVIILKDQLQ